jgi:SNF2 family DNA or RNA helicase
MSTTNPNTKGLKPVTDLAVERNLLEEQYLDIANGMTWLDGMFPHQWLGACFGAVAQRWLLADEPGAGKTRQAIAWLDLIGARKIVVFVERNLAGQFAGEVMELAPHRHIVNLTKLTPKTRHERLQTLLRTPQAVAVVNYEMLRDVKALNMLLLWQADTIVCDESHGLKSKRSKAFRSVKKLVLMDNTCQHCEGLVYSMTKPCSRCGRTQTHEYGIESYLSTKSVKYFLAMTGTPILNSPMDTWTMLNLIDPVMFRDEDKFKKNFLKMNYVSGKYEFRAGGLDDLKPLIEDRYLQRTLAEVGIDLPEQRIHFERVDLDPAKYPLQARTIEQVSRFAQIMLSDGSTMTLMHLISILLRKRQANVWPGGIEMRDSDGNVVFSVGSEVRESVKMDVCQEKIMDLHAQGHRQIVFSQFKTALAEFADRLTKAGLKVARFDGDTKDADRETVRQDFRYPEGEADVVLVHYRAGGSGLNLQGATVTHILDEEWSAGKRNQGYARNHRIGQESITDVFVYRIPNTVDTFMANLIHYKERMMHDLHRTMTNDEMMRSIRDALKNGDM